MIFLSMDLEVLLPKMKREEISVRKTNDDIGSYIISRQLKVPEMSNQ